MNNDNQKSPSELEETDTLEKILPVSQNGGKKTE